MSTTVQPLGKRFLMRKSSNTENLPPSAAAYHKKAGALVSAREASRRRRARVVSGSMPLKSKKLIQNAQRRVSKAQHAAQHPKIAPETVKTSAPSEPVELVNQTQSQATTTPATTPVVPAAHDIQFPRYLRRPPRGMWPVPFRLENIDACDPALSGTPLEYIRQGLEVAGESYVHFYFLALATC